MLYGCDNGHEPVAWSWEDGDRCWYCGNRDLDMALAVWRRNEMSFTISSASHMEFSQPETSTIEMEVVLAEVEWGQSNEYNPEQIADTWG